MLKRAALNFCLKVGGGGLGILATALASRNMSPTEYGTVATIFSFCALSGGLLALGGDHFFKKYFGERSSEGISGSLLLFISTQVILISSLLGVVAVHWVGMERTGYHFVVMCTFLIASISIQKSCSGSLVGLGHANVDASLSGVFRQLIIVAILFIVIVGFISPPQQLSVEVAVQAQLGGYVFALIVSLVCIATVIRKRASSRGEARIIRDPYLGFAGYIAYIRESVPMTVIGATGLLERNIDTLMLAGLSGVETAGKYFILTRVSVLAMMPLQAFNATNSRRLSKLIEISDKQKISKVCRKISAFSGLIVGAIVLVVVVFGPWLLGLFGESYSDAWLPLALLLFSWLLRSLMGPVNLLAVLSGHSGWAARVSSFSLVANVLLNAILIPSVGIYGAILATVTTRLVRSLAISRYIKRQLGVKVGFI